MFRKSLRTKLLLIFLFVALVPLITASALQLNYFNNINRQSIQEEELKSALDYSDRIDSWVTKKASQLEGLIKAHPELKHLDKKQAAALLKTLLEIDGDLETPAVADRDGKGLTSGGSELDVAERDYFKDVRSKKTPVVSDILTSKVTGNKIIMFAAPILDDSGDFEGALLSPVSISSLEKIVGNIKVKNTGYGALLNRDGAFIFHPDRNVIGKSYQEYSKSSEFIKMYEENILAGKTGTGIYTDEKGAKQIMVYNRIPATGWYLVVVIPYNEAFEYLGTIFTIFLVTLIVALVFVSAASLFASGFVAKPIEEISKVTAKAERGDFTERLNIKRADEVGRLTGSINNLLDSLSSMISGIRDKSHRLDRSSSNLSGTSQQIAASSQEVAAAIQEAAKGASEQSKDLETINIMLGRFNSELDSIHELLVSVNESTELTEKMSSEGSAKLKALTSSIAEIKKAFEAELDNINQLDGNIQKIDEITELIKSISDQTNLLALNAAIEAARAGEAGKGFAVVSDEIRKLAEQSRRSSDGIAQIVKTITLGTREIVAMSNEVEGRLNSQINVVSYTTKSFEEILNSLNDTIPKVKRAFGDVNSLVKEKDVIIEKVQSLSAVSQETTATAEEVAASAQEMAASTQEISSMAQDLHGISYELNEKVGEFQLK